MNDIDSELEHENEFFSRFVCHCCCSRRCFRCGVSARLSLIRWGGIFRLFLFFLHRLLLSLSIWEIWISHSTVRSSGIAEKNNKRWNRTKKKDPDDGLGEEYLSHCITLYKHNDGESWHWDGGNGILLLSLMPSRSCHELLVIVIERTRNTRDVFEPFTRNYSSETDKIIAPFLSSHRLIKRITSISRVESPWIEIRSRRVWNEKEKERKEGKERENWGWEWMKCKEELDDDTMMWNVRISCWNLSHCCHHRQSMGKKHSTNTRRRMGWAREIGWWKESDRWKIKIPPMMTITITNNNKQR